MGENTNKVSLIVDKIVESNYAFKLKDTNTKNKEKESLIRSINSALSKLNENGRMVVLEELGIDPEVKFNGFIDSSGNIDISGIVKKTSEVVKNVIELSANGEKLLRENENNFKYNKSDVIVDAILSAELLSKMKEDFKSLTPDERMQLIENYGDFSYEDKKSFIEKFFKNLEDFAKSDAERELLKKDKRELDLSALYQEALNSVIESVGKNEKLSVEDLIKKLKEIEPQITEEDIRKIIEKHDVEKNVGENHENSLNDSTSKIKFWELIRRAEIHIDNYTCIEKAFDEINNSSKLTSKEKKFLREYLEKRKEKRRDNLKELDGNLPDFEGNTSDEAPIQNVAEMEKNAEANPEIFSGFELVEEAKRQQESRQIAQKDKEENNNLHTIITDFEGGIPDKAENTHLKRALEIYSNYLENLSQDDIDYLSLELYDNQIPEVLKDEFQELQQTLQLDSETSKILDKLASLEIGGKIKQVLGKPDLIRREFLQEVQEELAILSENQISDPDVANGIDKGRVSEEFLDASAAEMLKEERTAFQTQEQDGLSMQDITAVDNTRNSNQAETQMFFTEGTESNVAASNTDTSGVADNNTGNAHKVADMEAMMAFLGTTVSIGAVEQVTDEIKKVKQVEEKAKNSNEEEKNEDVVMQ